MSSYEKQHALTRALTNHVVIHNVLPCSICSPVPFAPLYHRRRRLHEERQSRRIVTQELERLKHSSKNTPSKSAGPGAMTLIEKLESSESYDDEAVGETRALAKYQR